TNSFNKRRCNQHRRLNFSVSLGLTGNSFHSLATDHSDTDTGTDDRQTCSYYTWNFHNLSSLKIKNKTLLLLGFPPLREYSINIPVSDRPHAPRGKQTQNIGPPTW